MNTDYNHQIGIIRHKQKLSKLEQELEITFTNRDAKITQIEELKHLIAVLERIKPVQEIQEVLV